MECKRISIFSALLVLVFSILLSTSCKKSGGGGGGLALALMSSGSAGPDVPPASLAKPTGVTATESFTDHVTITWNAVPNARFYKVYRDESEAGTYGLLLGENNVASYNDTTATQGLIYYYKVEAEWRSTSDPTVVNSGKSDVYDDGYALLNAPATITASNNNGTEVTVDWVDVTNASTYHVLRSTTQTGSYTDLDTINVSLYNDTTAIAGTKYYYKVIAYSATDLPGLESTVVNGYRCTAAPGNFTASDGTFYTRVRLNWDPAADTTGYEVYRGETLLTPTPTGSTTYDDTAGVAGTAYQYKVVAVHTNGGKSFPAEDPGKRRSYSETIPCTVTWTANREKAVNSSGGGYRVYYRTSSIPDTGFESITHADVPWVSGLAPTMTTINLGPGPGTWYIRVVGYSGLNSGSTSRPSTQIIKTIN
ncbi:MAG: hypothetical protein A2W19_06005 [Spirochaetes bacterium RBG_16_49_21]|nr:MAG: hypothetical protein A2W19_06005 [Spirochaetes bacterium RBG_16_49_21]